MFAFQKERRNEDVCVSCSKKVRCYLMHILERQAPLPFLKGSFKTEHFFLDTHFSLFLDCVKKKCAVLGVRPTEHNVILRRHAWDSPDT